MKRSCSEFHTTRMLRPFIIIGVLVGLLIIGSLVYRDHKSTPQILNSSTTNASIASVDITMSATVMPTQSSNLPTPSRTTLPSVSPTPLPSTQPQGMVSLNFDDGFESSYLNSLPILNKAGLKTTQYIITGKFGDPAYVTKAQVLAMAAEGHEIGAHTRTHPHLSTLTAQQIHDEVFGSKQDLLNLGLPAVLSFAYPYGDHNALVDQITQSAGFTSIRTTVGGFNDRTTNPYALKTYAVESTTSFNEIKKWIDSAINNKQWLILTFHRTDQTGNLISVEHQLIQQVADYLVQQKIRVVTTTQGVHMLYGK